jgi:hypothetical protein
MTYRLRRDPDFTVLRPANHGASFVSPSESIFRVAH